LIERLGRGDVLYMHFGYRECDIERGGYGESQPWPEWANVYGVTDPDQAHVVAVIDGVIVDLTARQFRRDLPFPMFVDPATGTAL
jgi:hypothetical protein